MKHFIAILMVFALCLGTAYAAEWPEGTSPAKPYKGVQESDLDKVMGYMLDYPKVGDPAELYCDTLYIYLPREDVELGKNTMKVIDENGEYISVSFDDTDHVRLYKLDDETLSDLMWGSGVCIEILLPVSLGLSDQNLVLLEAGCFTAKDGSISNPVLVENLPDNQSWHPIIEGDYGVAKLRYAAADSDPVKDAYSYKANPGAGDVVRFDVVLGGDAAYAVLESEDGSVTFEEDTVDETGSVTATLNSDDFHWEIMFMDAGGEILDYLEFDRSLLEWQD